MLLCRIIRMIAIFLHKFHNFIRGVFINLISNARCIFHLIFMYEITYVVPPAVWWLPPLWSCRVGSLLWVVIENHLASESGRCFFSPEWPSFVHLNNISEDISSAFIMKLWHWFLVRKDACRILVKQISCHFTTTAVESWFTLALIFQITLFVLLWWRKSSGLAFVK